MYKGKKTCSQGNLGNPYGTGGFTTSSRGAYRALVKGGVGAQTTGKGAIWASDRGLRHESLRLGVHRCWPQLPGLGAGRLGSTLAPLLRLAGSLGLIMSGSTARAAGARGVARVVLGVCWCTHSMAIATTSASTSVSPSRISLGADWAGTGRQLVLPTPRPLRCGVAAGGTGGS